jgi:hypothetical protein
MTKQTNQTTVPRSELRWDARRKKLVGTIMGVPAVMGRGHVYQGELITGKIVTVYWDGTKDADPCLYHVDSGHRAPSFEGVYRWFNTLAAVTA